MLKKYLMVMMFLCLVMMLGCKPSNPYGAVRVRGNISVDGAAVQGITVTFKPVSGESGMDAYGLTDDKGDYVLTTGGAPFGTGAVPGKYHVTLSKVVTKSSEPQLTIDEYNALAAPGKPRGKPGGETVHQIPEKYINPETSGLEPVEVRHREANVFDFTLTSGK